MPSPAAKPAAPAPASPAASSPPSGARSSGASAAPAAANAPASPPPAVVPPAAASPATPGARASAAGDGGAKRESTSSEAPPLPPAAPRPEESPATRKASKGGGAGISELYGNTRGAKAAAAAKQRYDEHMAEVAPFAPDTAASRQSRRLYAEASAMPRVGGTDAETLGRRIKALQEVRGAADPLDALQLPGSRLTRCNAARGAPRSARRAPRRLAVAIACRGGLGEPRLARCGVPSAAGGR